MPDVLPNQTALAAAVNVIPLPEGVFIRLSGALDSQTTGDVWRRVFDALAELRPKRAVVDLSDLHYCDAAGVALLIEIRRQLSERGARAQLEGVRDELKPLLALFDAERYFTPPAPRTSPTGFIESLGRGAFDAGRELAAHILFLGELILTLAGALRRPRTIRWGDTMRTAELAGVNALPIVLLIGFLIGLIMAFQAAIPMRQFAAEIFVADLIGLSMLRELGPLMAAIMLAGRSSSAFAAEIGTMKVNEEVNALVTMGLEPMQFLVVPRVIAATLMTPILAVFSNVAGLAGGLVVLVSLGYPPTTYFHRLTTAVGAGDLLSGLVKAFVFGLIVAGVGCMRGLQTRFGAGAVGISTTRAVVTSIVLIIAVDGVFSVVYYYLGI